MVMKKKQYDELFEYMINEVKDTRNSGQKEYAHDVDNVFANFDRTAELLDTTREKVMMTFLLKHIDGVSAWVKGHKSQREKVQGRIKDLIVYLTLMWAAADESNYHKDMDKLWDQQAGDMGFIGIDDTDCDIEAKTVGTEGNHTVFNPETGEVKYQTVGDEVV
tara:strand:- start:706 stop:1194 length:489 start_codon:yes stop_codon:yes gene_type:complete